MRTIHLRTAALFAICFGVGCGLENSLVGGRCVDGLVLVGDACVPERPTAITPTEPFESTVTVSGSVDGGAPRGRVAPRVPEAPEAPPVTETPPFVEPPLPFPFDPAQPPPEPLVPPVDAGPPELECIAPLVACRGQCISVASDGANCGACGKICPSNICIAGECQGATPGDVVLIGHDFANASAGTAQSKVLVNALSIPTTDPIRVLAFAGNASSQAVAQAEALAQLGIKGRKVRFTHASATSALASSTLSQSYDVVLLHDAGSGDPVSTGSGWSVSLGTFAAKGGVVVVVDNGSSPMPALVSSTGLLAVGAHTLLPASTHLLVAAAADVVGAQVLSPYAAMDAPVSFQGVSPEGVDLTYVVRRKDDLGPGDPVVVHRVVR